MIKKFFLNYWPLVLILILSLAFHIRLFLPDLSIYVTPDYGRSDFLHFNIPVRMIMSEALKNHSIPFWTTKIGQGFPLIDEGQIGFFYLPNLLTFGTLPFWISYNLGYIIAFSLAAVGTYLFARSHNLDKVSSYLASITYTFSPVLVLRLHHYNYMQAASVLPLTLYIVNKFFKTKKISYLICLSILISQLIFIGFQQITFYTLILLFVYVIFKLKTSRERTKPKLKLLLITLSVLTATIMSSIQISQSFNLTQQSNRLSDTNVAKILNDFPYKFRSLLTLINPYIDGSPKDATYPRWEIGKWGLFWENNSYFGIIQLILIVILIIKTNKILSQTDRNLTYFFLFVSFIGIALALGADGPLHPIFSLPPLNNFRVPSRFLIFTFFGASMLSGIAFKSILQFKGNLIKFGRYFLIFTATIANFSVWYKYPLIDSVKNWSEIPTIASKIPANARIVSLGQSSTWNEIYLNKGWKGQEENYLFLRNYLGENSNVIYNRINTLAYAGLKPIRQDLVQQLIEIDSHNSSSNKSSRTLDPLSQKALDFTSTDYVISDIKLDSENLALINSLDHGEIDVHLYKNKSALPHVYTVGKFEAEKNPGKILEILKNDEFDPSKNVLLEESLSFKSEPDWDKDKNNVKVTDYKENKVVIETYLENDSIVVLTDSYYPGWRATLDGKNVKIFAANINSRAVIVPSGKHTLIQTYHPKSADITLIVSMLSSFAVGLLLIVTTIKKWQL